MSAPDPLRYARRLMEAARAAEVLAWGAEAAGDADALSGHLRRVIELHSAARWAADSPTVGPQLLREHGIDPVTAFDHELEETRKIRTPGAARRAPGSRPR